MVIFNVLYSQPTDQRLALSSLPPELLVNVLAFLDDGDSVTSLRSCSLVSHAWTYISQALLFQSVTLRTPTEVTAFMFLLNDSPHISPLVRSLSAEPRGLHYTSTMAHHTKLHEAIILRIAFRLPNLKHLHLSPLAFFKLSIGTRDIFARRFRKLQSLKFTHPTFNPIGGQYRAFLECCLRKPCLKSFEVELDQYAIDSGDHESSAMVYETPPKFLRSLSTLEVKLEELILQSVSQQFWLDFESLCVATRMRATRVKLLVRAPDLRNAMNCLSVLANSVEKLEFAVALMREPHLEGS